MSTTATLREHARSAAGLALDGRRSWLVDLSRRIHATPELAFEERRSCATLVEALTELGFAVECPAGGLPTAFAARAGSGELEIAFVAEYDALPEVGHACGHNLIAAMAVGAALGLAASADELDITVRVIGTPGEEGGGGKALMLDAGAFEGVHAALMAHPAPYEVLEPPMIALTSWKVSYRGRAAHASVFPEQGINAADALTVAQVGIGLLRQHLPATARVHGIVVNGGDQANIVPEHTQASYYVRAPTVGELDELEPRVRACFEAGALATGAQCSVEPAAPRYAHMLHDADLSRLYRANAEGLGRSFAGPEVSEGLSGSTDMGNVSQAIPSIHPLICIDSLPAQNHEREFADACISPAADEALRGGALAMALTAVDAATDPELRKRLLACELKPSGPRR
jgi:amidohydrolase